MTRRAGLSYLPMLVAAVAFLYILLRPVSNGNILLPMLLTPAVLGIGVIMLTRRQLDRRYVLIFTLQMLFFVLGITVGLRNLDTRGQALIWFGVPVTFLLIVWAMTERGLRVALWTLTIGTAILGTGIILFIGNQQGVLPQVIPPYLLEQSGAYFSGNYVTTSGAQTAINIHGLATLVAAAPIMVASLFIAGDHLWPPTLLRGYAAATAVVAAIVAGRRAIVVTVILAPLLLIVVRWVLNARSARRVVRPRSKVLPWLTVAGMVAGIVAVSRFAFDGGTVSGSIVLSAINAVFVAFFGVSFGGVLDQSDLVRQQENSQLIGGWHTSPIYGRGFGAVLDTGYTRSTDAPWDFESQYHVILFNTGMIGVALLLATVVTATFMLRAAVRARPDLTPTIVITSIGALSLLFGAASNPYYQAPGYYWPLYLALAAGNVALTTKERPFWPREKFDDRRNRTAGTGLSWVDQRKVAAGAAAATSATRSSRKRKARRRQPEFFWLRSGAARTGARAAAEPTSETPRRTPVSVD